MTNKNHIPPGVLSATPRPTVRLLMNSAMMPAPGTYRLRWVSRDEFVREMREGFVSYIGYPDTARYLERLSGFYVPVNRDETLIFEGAVMLICKLRYRLSDPAQKGRFTPSDDDYEFFICRYDLPEEVQP
jgi:hypothetical protein